MSAHAVAAASSLAAGPPRRGVISFGSAACLHDLPLIRGATPTATVSPRYGGKLPDWRLHWCNLTDADVELTPDGHAVTTLLRTLLDCGRTLPLLESVPMFDRALHEGWLTEETVRTAVLATRGPGVPLLRRAFGLADRRAMSTQESVGRVALALTGMPAIPQFRLDEPFGHRFDLGLPWARTVVDLQSKEHHSAWASVAADIEHQTDVTLTPGWELVWSIPAEVLPDPEAFVRKVLAVVVRQPGKRCAKLRRLYVDLDGRISYPRLAEH